MVRKCLFLFFLGGLLLSPEETSAQIGQHRRVNETLIARVSFSPQVRKTFTVSPDSRRIAFVGHTSGKSHISVDGKDQSHYDEIVGRPIFSPDGKRVAYTARRGSRWVVVIDGREEKPYDDIVGDPLFSPDSHRVAYVARKGDKELVVIDGAEQESFDEIGRTPIRKGKVVFSPDSRRVAYVSRSDGKQRVIVDGARQRDFDILGSNALWSWDIPVFSPDSRRLAYQVRIGGKWFAVIDGVEEKKGYGSVGTPVFNPDNERIGYVAVEGEKHVAVVNGSEGKAYTAVDLLTFSPDGNHFAYRAYERGRVFGGKWYIVLDGREAKEFNIVGDAFQAYGPILFSPDSRRVAHKTRLCMVVDGKEEKHYEKTGFPVFSPDSLHVAYMAGTEKRQFAVIDGKQGKAHDSPGSRFFLANPVFSPDSRRVAYAARSGKMWNVVVDGVEGRLYDEILVFPGGEQVFDSFDNHPYHHGYHERIKTELAARGRIVFDAPDRLHYLALKGDGVYRVEERFE